MEKKSIMYGLAKVGTKGQMVPPEKLRKDLNIKEGDALIFLCKPEQKGFAVMKPEGMQVLQKELEDIQQTTKKEIVR